MSTDDVFPYKTFDLCVFSAGVGILFNPLREEVCEDL